jgi:hopanoid biosynthesis associated protein HpnK
MKRLIVNADDFGVTRGVNQGIIRCFQEGIVRSTTLMANGDAFDDAVELAQANPELGVGVHLVLIGGRALAPREQIGRLAGTGGALPKTVKSLILKLSTGRIRANEMEAELRAQIERIRAAGVAPTHVDSHKHAHLHPAVMNAIARVADEFGIKRVRMPFEDFSSAVGRSGENGRKTIGRKAFAVGARASYPLFRRIVQKNRMRTPEHFFGFATTGQLGRDGLLRIIRRLPDGTSELVCHPGINDVELERTGTRLRAEREVELAALTDLDVKKEILGRGVHLMSFRELN